MYIIKKLRTLKTKIIKQLQFCLLIGLIFTQVCQAGVDFIDDQKIVNWLEVPISGVGENDDMVSRAVTALLPYSDHETYIGTRHGVFLCNKDPMVWTKKGLETERILALQRHDKNIYVATLSNGIFMATPDNNGTCDWHNIGLAHENILAMSIYNDYLYVGTASGKIYQRKIDDDKTWLEIGLLENKNVYTLCAHEGYLYAGTDHGGVFKTKLVNNSNKNIWQSLKLVTLTNKTVLTLCAVKDVLYAGTYGDGVFKLNLISNTTWSSFFKLPGKTAWDDTTSLTNKHVFTLITKGQYLIAGTGDDAFKLDLVNQVEWKKVTRTALSGKRILTLARTIGTGKLYAGTDCGEIHYFVPACASDLPKSSSGPGGGFILDDKALIRTARILHSHNGFLYAVTSQGLFRTNDQKTWSFVNGWGARSTPQIEEQIKASPVKEMKDTVIKALGSYKNELYVATDSGIFRAIEGETGEIIEWKLEESEEIKNAWIWTLCPYQGNLYAGKLNGIAKKIGSEGKWQNLKVLESTVDILCPSSELLYMATASRKEFLTAVEDEAEEDLVIISIRKMTEEEGLIQALCVHYNHIYIGTSTGIFKTELEYNDLKPCDDGLKNKSITTLLSYGGYLYAGTKDDGIFRKASNEDKWLPAGLTHEYALVLTEHQNKLYVGTKSGMVVESNDEAWQKDADLALIDVKSLHTYNGYLYANTADGKILIAENNNEKKFENMDGLRKNSQANVLYRQGDRLYAGASDGWVYILKDSTLGKFFWSKISSELKGQQVTSLLAHKNYLYAGTKDGVYKMDIYNDAQWNATRDRMLKDLQIETMYVYNDNLYAGTSNGVHKIKNSESLVGAGLKGKRILSMHACNNKLYAGTDQHEIYKLEGDTWIRVLPQQEITSFYVKDDVLFAGAADGRVFATHDDELGWTNTACIGKMPVFYTDNSNVYVKTLDGFYKK